MSSNKLPQGLSLAALSLACALAASSGARASETLMSGDSKLIDVTNGDDFVVGQSFSVQLDQDGLAQTPMTFGARCEWLNASTPRGEYTFHAGEGWVIENITSAVAAVIRPSQVEFRLSSPVSVSPHVSVNLLCTKERLWGRLGDGKRDDLTVTDLRRALGHKVWLYKFSLPGLTDNAKASDAAGTAMKPAPAAPAGAASAPAAGATRAAN